MKKPKKTPDELLRDLAVAEDNVVTRQELAAIKFSDRMIERMRKRLRWQTLQDGVYLMSAAPPSWRQRCRAALKAAGPNSMLHGETGLAALGVDGCNQRLVHIQVLRPAQPRLRDARVHRTSVPDLPRATPDGLKTSSVERLLLDFAATASLDRVEVALESAIAQGLTVERRLWQLLAAHSFRMPGVARLTRALEQRPLGKAARSKLEIEFFKLLRKNGVSLPVRNFDTWVEGKRYELDCAYVATRKAVELDSRRFHSTASQKRRDKERQTILERLGGWAFLRITWTDVLGRPDWVVEQVRAHLAGADLHHDGANPGQRAG